jgi:hypothetical protein
MKILDTRDLQKRLEELEEIEADCKENNVAEDADEAEELTELRNMVDEIYDWKDGATLIPVDDFTEYVQDMLDVTGEVPKDIPSFVVIDWEATAENLKSDYSEIDYQGETYLYRNC